MVFGMAISNSEYDTSGIHYVWDPYGKLPNSTGSKFLTIDATELVGGKRWGVVLDATVNEFTGLMSLPLDQIPGGAQQWIDATSGDLHFMIRNDEQNILGMLTIEGWRDAWPKADEILGFDTLRMHPLNKFTFITKEVTFEDINGVYPYTDVSNFPGPTDDYNNEDNYFDLSVQIETLSFDPSTNEPNLVTSTATYTGSEFLDFFTGGPNNTTYISVGNKEGIWPDTVHYKGTLQPIIVDFETSTVFKEEWQTTDDFSAVASITVDGSNNDDVFISPSHGKYAWGWAGNDWFKDVQIDSGINPGRGADLIVAAADTNTSGSTAVWLEIDGKWGANYIVRNVGSMDGDIGTRQQIDIEGYAKIEDTVLGNDQVKFRLGLEEHEFVSEKGVVIALDDNFSARNTNVSEGTLERITNITEIKSSTANDIVDLTSISLDGKFSNLKIETLQGNDVIWGSSSDEIILAGDGGDIVFGGSGSDTLTGGGGADTFEFTATSGADTLLDYSKADGDVLKFYVRSGSAEETAEFSISGNKLVWGDVEVAFDGVANLNGTDLAIKKQVIGSDAIEDVVLSTVVGGNAVKGPLQNALVFADLNGNWVLDATENSVRTAADGSFILTVASTDTILVVLTDETTIDTSSGVVLDDFVMSAPLGSTVITPLTTLAETTNLTSQDLSAVLGLPDIDIFNFNPFGVGVDASEALTVEKISHQLTNVIRSFSAALDASEDTNDDAFFKSFDAVSDVVKDETAAGSTIDLGDQTFLEKIASELLLENTAIATIVPAIANVNQAIENVSDLTSSETANAFAVSNVLVDQIFAISVAQLSTAIVSDAIVMNEI